MELSRYQLIFSAQETISFSQFPGSALRGIFGGALKLVSCITQRENCLGCVHKKQCAFPQVFKTTRLEKEKFIDIPQPLVLDVSEVAKNIQPQTSFTLYFNLVGSSINYIETIIQAWVLAGKLGLKHKGRPVFFQLQSVEAVDISMPKIISQSQKIIMDLVTPHRSFRREGPKRYKKLITPETFIVNTYLANIVRRYASLQKYYGKELSRNELQVLMDTSYALKPVTKTLTKVQYYRISKTQNKKIDLSGIIGQLGIIGKDLSTMLPILWLGQWLHVGNNTMYGLGRYRITGVRHV